MERRGKLLLLLLLPLTPLMQLPRSNVSLDLPKDNGKVSYTVTIQRNDSAGIQLVLHEHDDDGGGSKNPNNNKNSDIEDPSKTRNKNNNNHNKYMGGGSLFHIEWSVYDPRISEKVEEVEYRERASFPRRVFSIVACTYQDHFNGHYSICCPRPKRGKYGCHRLEVVRYYQKFQVELVLVVLVIRVVNHENTYIPHPLYDLITRSTMHPPKPP